MSGRPKKAAKIVGALLIVLFAVLIFNALRMRAAVLAAPPTPPRYPAALRIFKTSNPPPKPPRKSSRWASPARPCRSGIRKFVNTILKAGIGSIPVPI